MLTLKDDYLVFCKCIEEYTKFKNCYSCVNYTNVKVIDLTEEDKQSLFCKYKEQN